MSDKLLKSLHGRAIGLDANDRLVRQGVRLHGDSHGTATATAGAATLNKAAGKVTSEALTTAAAAAYTLTVTCSEVAAADLVFASIANGTNTQGIPVISRVTPAAGSFVVVVSNQHATEALNGTLVVSYEIKKASTT